MPLWTHGSCKLGHIHRSSEKRHWMDAIKPCNRTFDRLCKKFDIDAESVCEKCFRDLTKRGANLTSVGIRECDGCHDKVCKHFFPIEKRATGKCYACEPIV